ncbi:S8 family serine peptidase, partial [Reichenbachiella sp.]|uniref:fibronectin type III domain-containing protein n=2 Tax=Reichenbachiella sp. TaxID=2184521 RepID=UPI00329A33CF
MRFFLTKILFKQGLLVGLTLLLASDLLAQDAQDRAYIMQKTNQGALMGIRTRGLQKQQNNLQTLSRQRVQLQVVNARGQLGVFYDFDENGNPVYAFDDNVDAAASGRTDRIWTGGSSGLDLTGAGIEIGVWESGYARATHQEFAGRASNGGDGGSDTSHGTHTGGTLIASGVNPSARGMASAATIKNYTATNMISEAATFAAAGGILANNSNTPGGSVGTYDANARDMDNVVYNAPYYFHGKSAGNDGNNYGSVLKTTQLSKNLLVVGNCNDVTNYTGPSSVTMSSSSSYGPTPDWRIKPDITNNGTSVTSSNSGSNTAYTAKSGTSMSTPATIGTVALLQQHYHNLNTVYMRAATVKALLINTADEAGANPGPDFASGWGLVNAERAAEVISNNGVNSIVEELTLNNGGTYTSTIISDGSTPLSLSIAWTDPAGTISSSTNPVLVNDLDVRVTGNSNTYSPWAMIPNGSFNNYTDAAQKGDNFRDNVEKIDAVLAAGTYTVSVTHKGTLTNGSQDFSMIINGVVVSLDSEAPTAPTALNSSNVTENSVDLSWTASTDNVGVMSYEIFEGSTSVGTSTTTNFSVTGLAHSTTFSFTVNAKDAAGNTSGNSNTVNVTTLTPVPDTQAPTIPTGLSSSNITQTSVDLSWTASTDNVGVTGYDVLEGATVVGSSTSTNFTVIGLLANTSHSYTVKAKDTAGNVSGNSSVINITTLAVPPCSGISSFPYSESFDGNTGLWTQETSDDLNWSFDTNSTPSSNTGPSAPTDGSSYMFTEATGNGTGFPNKVTLLTSPCVDLSSLGNAELNFDYHMYGAAMGTLEIRASTDGGTNWTTIWSQTGDQGNQWLSQSVSLSAYSGSVINLQISGTTGSNFTSDMAIDNLQIVSLIVDTQAPSVPSGLAASNTSDTGTTLSWTASTDNIKVTSYEVFQGGTSIGTSATTSFNVTGLTAETAYSFAVNASDAAGNTSANSAALSVTTTAVPPCSGISSFPYSESFDGNTGLWTQETSDDLNWSFDTNS